METSVHAVKADWTLGQCQLDDTVGPEQCRQYILWKMENDGRMSADPELAE